MKKFKVKMFYRRLFLSVSLCLGLYQAAVGARITSKGITPKIQCFKGMSMTCL